MLQTLPIGQIRIPEGRRPVGDTTQLEQSIRDIGLINPVTVTPGNVLVAGFHRVTACLNLGWETIPVCVVEPEADTSKELALKYELAEIDENLCRNELNDLEHCEQVARRKVVYEELHPETKPTMGNSEARRLSEIISFSQDTAEKIGATPRTVEQEVKIAKSIVPEVKALIRETEVADRKTDLIKLSRMEPEKQAKVAEKLVSGEAKNATEAERQLKTEEKREKWAEPVMPVEQLEGPYQVIYADPPWRYEHSMDDGDKVENHYPTMELQEICDLPVADIADADCVLFLWATSPKLKEAMQVVESWGFDYRTCMVWDKGSIGPGYYARQQHELLLICIKGKPGTPLAEHRPPSVFKAPRRDHSRKPDEFYGIVERMYPLAKRVELFCRTPQPGWSVWGNEV